MTRLVGRMVHGIGLACVVVAVCLAGDGWAAENATAAQVRGIVLSPDAATPAAPPAATPAATPAASPAAPVSPSAPAAPAASSPAATPASAPAATPAAPSASVSPVAPAAPPDWLANDAITHFHEAITAVRAQAAAPQPPETMVRDALKAYLRSLDPYSGYLTPQEYATGKDVADAAYAGVGMDLFPDHDGSLVCIPFPGGPAAQAGVRYGDVLVAVDGAPVRGLGVLDIGVRVRGQKGSPVSLAVASPGASPRTVELKRDTIAFRSVAVFAKAKPLPVIRIYRFGDATRRELKKAIASIGLLTDKIIDLRGTIGGDLEEAMACAKLFLESGQTIASLHSPSGEVVYTVDREPSDLFSRLFIWQDRMTAGEAEAFVSGLVLNGRAMSMGQRTFGKGSVQSVVGLSDGSAVVVTHGLLHAANGKVFDGVGLEPDVSIPPESAGDDAFFAKEVEKALKPGLL